MSVEALGRPGKTRRDERRRKNTIADRRTVGGTVARIGMFLVYAVPLAYVLAISVKPQVDVLADPAGLDFSPTLENFRTVYDDAWPAMLNSLQIAVGTSLLCIVLSVPAAYGLARRRSRSWTIATTTALALLIILQMVPQAMSVMPLYGLLAQLHLINTLFGVVVATTALLVPFAVLLLRPFFVGVPPALEEAAMVDGASLPRMFWSVVLPLVRNGIATVGVMVFILSWGEFIYGTTFLSEPGGYPVSAVLAAQSTLYGPQYGRLMALATLTTLPIVLVFLASQRRLVDGMLTGAVK